MIETPGGAPIHIGRPWEDGAIRQKDLPFEFSLERARACVTDEFLRAAGVSRKDYESGNMDEVQRRELFLLVYAVCGNVRVGCAAVGVKRFTVEAWRMDVENFKRDMDLAYEDCVDELEAEARLRATRGRPWEEITEKETPEGTEVTRRRGVERSDAILMFLLKGQRSRYGNKLELEGAVPVELKEVRVTIVDPDEKQQPEEGSK